MAFDIKPPSSRKARFAAVGDISLGDQPACLGFGVRSLAEREGYRYFFGQMKDTFTQYELVVGNLEAVIARQSAVESANSAGLVDRADPEAASALHDAGIKLVGLANNHIFEYGEPGLDETVRHLDASDIAWTGRKNHVIREIAGCKVAFLSWSLLPDHYWPGLDPAAHYNVAADAVPILEEVARVRGSADYVVLLLHWGNELVARPSRTQQETGRMLIDAGVDVILGHHPHVLQPVEKYKNGVIAYSLGNFVMDSWQASPRTSVMLEITLGPEIEYRTFPVTIDRRTYRPALTRDEGDRSRTLALLDYREPLQETVYRQQVHRERKRYRWSLLAHFARNMHRVGPGNLAWVLAWGMRRLLFILRVARVEKTDPDIVYRGPMH